MLSTIMSGDVDFADIMFLVAVVLGAAAAVMFAVEHALASAVLAAAVAAVAFGLLAL